MSKRVLITGGAGFIGSHLADECLQQGYAVRVLDSLDPQVHGPERRRPAYLHADAELLVGDVGNPDDVRKALQGVDIVCHLAALVGIGQSMYQLRRYTEGNNLATAVLLEALIDHPVERLLVASSMSLYGEGLYRLPDGGLTTIEERPLAQLKARQWEPRTEAGEILMPVATPESKMPAISSIYALSKYDQERLCLIVGRAYNIPTVAVRFFNAYGPRQSLSNPYTGVLAIFAARLLNNKPPVIYEDGLQTRDFVSVHDIARGCRQALEAEAAPGRVFNLGSGAPDSILSIAERLARLLGRGAIEPEVTNTYRLGDIRHCFADITLARQLLGYAPQVSLDAGIEELAGWLDGQVAVDRYQEASLQLAHRGLTV